MRLSIIIPVWNSPETNPGKRLCRCFDSCIGQKITGFEVIAVNDCSPNPQDEVIMREYETKYPDIFRGIYLTSNVGQGRARNIGIENARGEWLMFCDNDDYYESNAAELLLKAVTDQNAGMACAGYYKLQGEKRHIFVAGKTDKHSLLKSEWLIYPKAMWCKIIKKEIIVKNELWFYESDFEDINSFVLPFVTNCVRLKTPVYNWNCSKTQQTNELLNQEGYALRCVNAYRYIYSKIQALSQISEKEKAEITITLLFSFMSTHIYILRWNCGAGKRIVTDFAYEFIKLIAQTDGELKTGFFNSLKPKIFRQQIKNLVVREDMDRNLIYRVFCEKLTMRRSKMTKIFRRVYYYFITGGIKELFMLASLILKNKWNK